MGRLAGRGSAKLPEAAGGSDGEEAGGTVAKRARLQVRQGGVHLPDGDGPVTSDDDLRADLYRTVTMVGVDTIFSRRRAPADMIMRKNAAFGRTATGRKTVRCSGPLHYRVDRREPPPGSAD